MSDFQIVGMGAHNQAAAPYTANDGALFDGSADALTTTNTSGFADNKLMTISLWFKPDTAGTNSRLVGAAGPGHTTSQGRFSLQDIGGNWGLRFFIKNDINSPLGQFAEFDMSLNNDDTTWYHFMLSFDLANSSNRHTYLDNVSQGVSWSTYTDENIPWLSLDFSLGANGTGASNRYSGALQEVWIANQYIDLSNAANRAKFIDGSGKPVDLGTDGTGPTGTAPLFLMRNAYGTFEQDQSGRSNDFTVTGALADEGSSPSD